jgi:Mg2+-importing ATPase
LVDASIILIIVVVSGLLGFWQEHSATNAVEKLLAMVQIKAAILRDKNQQELPVEDIVPGDVVILNAGDIVPGDCFLLESKDTFVDEAMLTGETFPVEKSVTVLPVNTALAQRTNTVAQKLWLYLPEKIQNSAKFRNGSNSRLLKPNLSVEFAGSGIFLGKLH